MRTTSCSGARRAFHQFVFLEELLIVDPMCINQAPEIRVLGIQRLDLSLARVEKLGMAIMEVLIVVRETLIYLLKIFMEIIQFIIIQDISFILLVELKEYEMQRLSRSKYEFIGIWSLSDLEIVLDLIKNDNLLVKPLL